MPLASHPYWTDYVSAFGAVVGIVVAGAAFVVALRSTRDAHRSAESAEKTANSAYEQLMLARAEHEQLEADRMRQPAVKTIDLSPINSKPGEQTPVGVFRIGFTNTGDRDLRDALLTILFDRGCAATLTDRWGKPQSDQSKDDTRERWPGINGAPLAFDYFVRSVTVQVGVSVVRYVYIPRAGRFPIRVKLFHAALTGSGLWTDRWIEIDNQGNAEVVDIADDGSAGPYNGRDTDFDPSLPDQQARGFA